MSKRALSIDEAAAPPFSMQRRGSLHGSDFFGGLTCDPGMPPLQTGADLTSPMNDDGSETMDQLVRRLSNSGDAFRILNGSQPRLSGSQRRAEASVDMKPRPFGSMDFLDSLGEQATGNISDLMMRRQSSLDMGRQSSLDMDFGDRPPIDSQSWTIPSIPTNRDSMFGGPIPEVGSAVDAEQQWREERLEHIAGADQQSFKTSLSDVQPQWSKINSGTVNRTTIAANGITSTDDIKVTNDNEMEDIMNDWRARRQQPTGPVSGENVRNSKDETENLKWLRESSLAAVEAIRNYQNRGTSSRGAHVLGGVAGGSARWNMSMQGGRQQTRTTIQAEWK